MRISIILGAGASLANGAHFRPVQDKHHPPLDYTFFSRIRRLGIEIPLELQRYARTLPSGSPFESAGREERMETFFRDMFYDFLDRGDKEAMVRRAYLQLVDIYARVIRETTNWMLADQYTGGPVGRLIAAAADAADDVHLITFNQDLVIENEIYRRARLRSRWCLERSYGSFSNGRSLIGSPYPMFAPHDDSCDHARGLVIHKLHGSMNWLVRIRGREPTHGVLTGSPTAGPADVMIARRRSVPGALRVNMPSGKGRRAWYTWPVIVPPIYDKQSLIRTFLPSVWADAHEALLHSDHVLFFGYSMPSADIEAEKLIERALTGNRGLSWVAVVDPSPQTAMRFMQVLPDVPLRRFPTANAFLAEETPWMQYL